jgi:Na+-transporting NADH:ubiquinone oxidoreductase subunit NqrA
MNTGKVSEIKKFFPRAFFTSEVNGPSEKLSEGEEKRLSEVFFKSKCNNSRVNFFALPPFRLNYVQFNLMSLVACAALIVRGEFSLC